jgi:hypothetical protein
VLELGTSTPPQSPVAWSNFITGLDPGGHGIFDFIHRDPETYTVAASTVTSSAGSSIPLPGAWEFPVGGGGDSNRTGKAFWTILGEHGVPADVWRMPINFPVESGKGWSFSGMMTPAIDSAYGEFTFYSTDPPASLFGNEKIIQLTEYSGVIRTTLLGPENPFQEADETTGLRPRATIPMTIYVDHENGGAATRSRITCSFFAREWSDFTGTDLLPLGLMGMSGTCVSTCAASSRSSSSTPRRSTWIRRTRTTPSRLPTRRARRSRMRSGTTTRRGCPRT